jgi:FixJ family two-component response regulator
MPATPESIPYTIYVVDDDPAVLDSVRALLGSHGLEVECYSSAEAFLESYDPGRRGCLLLDLKMPQMNGIELQQRLREAHRRLPILFLSGHGDVPRAVEAMRLGARDFIEKPYDPDTLVEKVHEAIWADAVAREPGEGT